MSIRNFLILTSLVAATACGSEITADPGMGPTGTLELGLAPAAADGATHRLGRATFSVRSRTTRRAVMTLEVNGEASISATLPADNYDVKLLDGWTLVRSDGAVETAEFLLATANPAVLVVAPGATTPLRLKFLQRVAGNPVEHRSSPSLKDSEKATGATSVEVITAQPWAFIGTFRPYDTDVTIPFEIYLDAVLTRQISDSKAPARGKAFFSTLEGAAVVWDGEPQPQFGDAHENSYFFEALGEDHDSFSGLTLRSPTGAIVFMEPYYIANEASPNVPPLYRDSDGVPQFDERPLNTRMQFVPTEGARAINGRGVITHLRVGLEP